MLLLFPCQILLAIAISIFFGKQLKSIFFCDSIISDQALRGISFLFTLFVIFLVGPFEEIGWCGYDIDSLRNKFNLMTTSLILVLFGQYAFSFILTFQQQIWNLGLLHTLTYFVCLFLMTIITNWLYVKNSRSILIAILFHSVYDICISIFNIFPFTWLILTLILLLTTIIIIKKNKNLFYAQDIK